MQIKQTEGNETERRCAERYKKSLHEGYTLNIFKELQDKTMAYQYCPKCNTPLSIQPVWIEGKSKGKKICFSPCVMIYCVKCKYIKSDWSGKVILLNLSEKTEQYSPDTKLFDIPQELYTNAAGKTEIIQAIIRMVQTKPKANYTLEELRLAYKTKTSLFEE